MNPDRITARSGLGTARPRRVTILVTSLILAAIAGFGCVEKTVAPVDTQPNMNGNWYGTRTQLVFDDSGVLVPDTTVVTDLTLNIGPGGVAFTDSEAGQLPTVILSMNDDRVEFTATNGLVTWNEVGVRTWMTLNGTETGPGSVVTGVWAVTKRQ